MAAAMIPEKRAVDGSGTVPGEGGLPLGVVLCGGESKRMGSDKGLLRESAPNGRTWCRIVYDLLSSLLPRVVISIHPTQKRAYRSLFPAETLVEDRYPRMGPLGGLLSVHELFPGADLAVLACDMIRMEGTLYGRLIAMASVKDCPGSPVGGGAGGAEPANGLRPRWGGAGGAEPANGLRGNETGMDAFLMMFHGKPEPLAAIYRSFFLNRLRDRFGKGELKNYSLRRVLEGKEVRYLDVPLEEGGQLSNFNAPEDWK